MMAAFSLVGIGTLVAAVKLRGRLSRLGLEDSSCRTDLNPRLKVVRRSFTRQHLHFAHMTKAHHQYRPNKRRQSCRKPAASRHNYDFSGPTSSNREPPSHCPFRWSRVQPSSEYCAIVTAFVCTICKTQILASCSWASPRSSVASQMGRIWAFLMCWIWLWIAPLFRTSSGVRGRLMAPDSTY